MKIAKLFFMQLFMLLSIGAYSQSSYQPSFYANSKVYFYITLTYEYTPGDGYTTFSDINEINDSYLDEDMEARLIDKYEKQIREYSSSKHFLSRTMHKYSTYKKASDARHNEMVKLQQQIDEEAATKALQHQSQQTPSYFWNH